MTLAAMELTYQYKKVDRLYAEIDYLRYTGKIKVIQELRIRFDCGLAPAKNAVDEIWDLYEPETR